MNEEIIEEINDDEQSSPLEYLTDKESELVDIALQLLDSSVTCDDLRERMVGAVLCEIEEWAMERIKKGAH